LHQGKRAPNSLNNVGVLDLASQEEIDQIAMMGKWRPGRAIYNRKNLGCAGYNDTNGKATEYHGKLQCLVVDQYGVQKQCTGNGQTCSVLIHLLQRERKAFLGQALFLQFAAQTAELVVDYSVLLLAVDFV
jgi:hypothetical protein